MFLTTLIASSLFSLIFILAAIYYDRLVWTRRRPDLPGPTGIPILGNLLQILPWRFRSIEWIEQMHKCHGDLFTVTSPPWGRAIFIGRPEWLAYVKSADVARFSRGPIAKKIFQEFPGHRTPVASEGAEWRITRKIITPIFTVKTFTDHVSKAMQEIMALSRTLLINASKRNLVVDWNDLSGRIALSIFCLSALNSPSDILREDIACLKESDKLRDTLLILNSTSSSRFLNPFWRFTELIDGSAKRFNNAREYIWELADATIADRQARISAGQSPGDYISELLGNEEYNHDRGLIRDTLVTLLFAGHDNTQNVLAWSMHALLSNAIWMEKMREEAITVNNSYEDELLYTNLSKYHVHLAVFYETIRLWPGLPKNTRLALYDDVLPEIPEYNLPSVRIMKGDYVCWSDYYMMRNPEIWGPDAGVFDPGRHLDAEGKFIRPTAPKFHGFGAGPRYCPAIQLASYEFTACWAGLLPVLQFKARYSEKPKFMEAFTACMSGPLLVEVEARRQ